MSKSVSNISDVATETQNTPGVLTSVLEITANNGTELLFRNAVDRGEQRRGIPIYMELYDSNGDPLPPDTEVALTFERPNDDDPSVISEPLANFQAYRTLDLKDQQNTDYVDRVKHVIRGRGVLVGQNDTFSVAINSSKEIDWATSRIQFEEDAVTER